MKVILALCLFGIAVARPQNSINPEKHATILSLNSVAPVDGQFKYDFETENGISANREGNPGSHGQSNVAGSYRYTLDDGSTAEIRYVADEFGFRAEGPLIPTPHPPPAHVADLLRIAEEQRAQGITFNK